MDRQIFAKRRISNVTKVFLRRYTCRAVACATPGSAARLGVASGRFRTTSALRYRLQVVSGASPYQTYALFGILLVK